MYKKKGNLVILSVAFLFFIAGCAGGEGTTTGAPTTPFIGGTEAIQIGFLEGSPPEEVTDQGSFPFQAIVSLKNVGEYDIAKGQIKTSLIGFLASQFDANVEDLSDKTLEEDELKGKKRDPDGNIIEPIETFLTFPTDDKNFEFDGDVIGNTIFIFRADACFFYSGDIRSELCILQNQIDVAPDAICKPTDSKSVFSSGSPVHITSFRQNVAGSNKVQFSFDVNHVGKGSLFSVDPSELTTTPDEVVTIDTDIVLIKGAIDSIDNAIQNVKDQDTTAALLNIDDAEVKISDDSLTNEALITTQLAAAKQDLIDAETALVIPDYVTAEAELNSAKEPLETAMTILNEERTKGINCPKDATTRRTEEDSVFLTVNSGLPATSYTLNCVGLKNVADINAKQEGEVKLVNGKRTITCTLDLPVTRTDFVNPIDIKAQFNYEQSADTDVLVKRLLTDP